MKDPCSWKVKLKRRDNVSVINGKDSNRGMVGKKRGMVPGNDIIRGTDGQTPCK